MRAAVISNSQRRITAQHSVHLFPAGERGEEGGREGGRARDGEPDGERKDGKAKEARGRRSVVGLAVVLAGPLINYCMSNPVTVVKIASPPYTAPPTTSVRRKPTTRPPPPPPPSPHPPQREREIIVFQRG